MAACTLVVKKNSVHINDTVLKALASNISGSIVGYVAMPCRSALQKVRRDRLVSDVVRHFHKKLKLPKHQRRIAMTNRLLPLGSLRKTRIQKVVSGWPNDFSGRRCFTTALVKQTNNILRAKYGLEPSDVEVGRIKQLLQTVRKRKVGLEAMAANPDELETLPMTTEDEVWFYKATI